MKKVAFTLAEVLITLGIIGVVAAMTMPTLINDTKNKELVTRLKKSYSVLSQATSLIQPGNPSYEWTFANSAPGIKPIWDLYKPYLNMIEDCGCNSTGCWSKDTTRLLNNSNYKYAGEYFVGYGTCSARLADGSNIVLDVYTSGSSLGFGQDSRLVFIVDVNGDKRPNQFGRDVFVFGINTDKGIIVPAGSYNDSPLCTPKLSRSDAGLDCAAKVLNENKIDY